VVLHTLASVYTLTKTLYTPGKIFPHLDGHPQTPTPLWCVAYTFMMNSDIDHQPLQCPQNVADFPCLVILFISI